MGLAIKIFIIVIIGIVAGVICGLTGIYSDVERTCTIGDNRDKEYFYQVSPSDKTYGEKRRAEERKQNILGYVIFVLALGILIAWSIFLASTS